MHIFVREARMSTNQSVSLCKVSKLYAYYKNIVANYIHNNFMLRQLSVSAQENNCL